MQAEARSGAIGSAAVDGPDPGAGLERPVMTADIPDLKGLRRFVAEGDRGTPACFAGRQAIIGAIARALDTVMDGAREERDVRSLTQLVQGAPGAGKTALLEEVALRLWAAETRRRPGDAQGPVPVMLARDALYSEEETVLAIVEAMAGAPGWTVRPADFRRTSTRDGGLRLPPLLSAAVRLGSSVAPEPEESREVVLGTLEVFRVNIEGGNADGWAVRLAEESEGWPQHLHNGMWALAEDLIEAGGRLADVDAGSVLGRGAELRRTSYRQRVSPEMQGARCLTGAVMQEIAAGAERAAVLGSIDRHSVRVEGSEIRLWRLPDDMTAPVFLDHLVHRGALQQGEDWLFRCPISSFRDYLVEQGGGQECVLEDGEDSRQRWPSSACPAS